ncbi:MAG: DNA mismatch repair endonuclease MutL [Ruminococcus sp.]|nr:DNA mismatch repair endonuclease MutL [Ruminococcus sp.]
MPQINLLDKSVYELIAAGEVIERPASIVKELIENSMDAGARQIIVEIKNGGRTFLRVTDNGCGIDVDDVPKAFLRHATSKVSSKEDLDRILTLGFRGEALASVCAVSKTEMFTHRKESEMGLHYGISGGVETFSEESACPIGTTIIVRDLFYNVPARLKFLKKDQAEANRIQELISRLAVSRPEIAIKLIRDNKIVFATAGDGKLYSAIYSVFGRELANTLLPVSYSRGGFTAEGFVSKPIASRPNRKLQIFYVNDRFVHSEVCSQALEEAYKSIIMVGKFPCCVMKLTVSPEVIDVNVHPAKTEIRFSDNRYIYDSVYFAVKQALDRNDRPLELRVDRPKHFSDSELYVRHEDQPPEQMVFETAKPAPRDSGGGDDLFLRSLGETMKKTPGAEFFAPVRGNIPEPPPAPEPQPFPEDMPPVAVPPSEPFPEDMPPLAVPPSEDPPQPFAGDTTEEMSAAAVREEVTEEESVSAETEMIPQEITPPKPDLSETVMPVRIVPEILARKDEEAQEKLTVIGELFKTYIVVQRGDSMILIDKHAAHERHIYEKLRFGRRAISSQTLLEPIIVVLSFDEYDAVAANIEKFEALGFIVEADVAPSIAITGLPDIVSTQNPTELITEIAQKLISGGSSASRRSSSSVLSS